ncbi:hypothetical protein LMG31841_03224 [Paraburkholderia saeva]|uniref:Uncharacterized protein n=1 Tax=Paraburkholderia saeva TaxID=2777537 RepID=A0A9N8RXP2_9BURK|nr:hypothetical protein LMG31841_03224 [Paraburkholderia saeva]
MAEVRSAVRTASCRLQADGQKSRFAPSRFSVRFAAKPMVTIAWYQAVTTETLVSTGQYPLR